MDVSVRLFRLISVLAAPRLSINHLVDDRGGGEFGVGRSGWWRWRRLGRDTLLWV